ncbi:proline iminopeptidase-family hydrolase [Olsenella sp. DNF00959]|uniref:proline iminopeptidase-family hydrolase n=1 Tax=Olsenella TaxID=133925 RepID=UPI0007855D39|nr:proline iminopeptidase-family hydrolase [Olsenella sp. DNF00959]KXB62750.1 prolyl aminopeptidase [Olsenella sp. DNF00959]
MHISEGYLPFLGHQTHWRVVEPDEELPGRAPLVLLHGGPGSTHNYFEVLDGLADLDGRRLVMYDQLGCGLSWDDGLAGHDELWRANTWLDELDALRAGLGLERIHLLGQSWGGMLALMHLLDRGGVGVRSMVLSSTLASASLWGSEGHRRLRYLGADERRAMEEAERGGRFDTPEFRAAEARYLELFCAGEPDESSPECLRRPKRTGRESYLAAWGDNELMPSGTLAGFEYAGRLKEVRCPALVVSGTQDLCSPLVAKQLADGIPGARWELFEGCRHACFVEDTPRYLAMLREWLDEND